MKTCSAHGCDRPHHAKGYCRICYQRWHIRTPRIAVREYINPKAQDVIALADAGTLARVIAKDLEMTIGAVVGITYRARERGDLVSDKITAMAAQYPGFPRNPFPDRGCLFPNQHEPRDPRFAFCGAPVDHAGSAWCPKHRRRVYKREVAEQE